MIERIKWSRRGRTPDGLLSPFMRGQEERPLAITFHSSSLTNATGEALYAIQALQDLRYVDGIKAVQTEPGDLPYINIGDTDVNNNTIPVQLVENDESKVYTGILFAQQLFQIAATIAIETNQNSKMILNDLLMAEAHIAVGGDIFVTSSTLLLTHRHRELIDAANPRTPEEAVKIIGLFLRSRDIYTYSAGKRVKQRCDRKGFYWVLARHRLPSMWRYFSGCLYAGKIVDEDLEGLGGSILTRAVRALEARDAIGAMFYIPQDNNTSDQIMYHFDYLTLVLSGALDAQARIARRAYKLAMKDWDVSFRKDKFTEALREKGAKELADILDDPQFKSYLYLLYELRNTIHGSAMSAMTFQNSGDPKTTLVHVPDSIAHSLWAHTDIVSKPVEWGLDRTFPFMLLEPYSYAISLVKYGFSSINRIAAATDVTRFFPSGTQIPHLMETEPDDNIWHWAERISILG